MVIYHDTSHCKVVLSSVAKLSGINANRLNRLKYLEKENIDLESSTVSPSIPISEDIFRIVKYHCKNILRQ